jgi:endonuclease/exonuclease/phosphatase family metal-dependent hydrolase
MKKIIMIISGCIGIMALGLAGLIGYATLSDYRPDPAALVYENQDAEVITHRKTFRLMIWNIGYGGLGRDMDFFYDGGKQVRPEKQTLEKNIAAIETFISEQREVDFFLFQEMDQGSKRSYGMNQYSRVAGLFPEFFSGFGKNYDVFFVPLPPFNPLGRVLSGLQTLSRFEAVSIVRYSFPGNFDWPKGLFMLDRCFLAARYRLDTGKDLLVINTHNSAYDDGTLRRNQMVYLKDFLIREYEKGNHVIVGGDWNQCPPDFKPDFKFNLVDNEERIDIDKAYLPGWKWAYDGTVPTNRRLFAPYNEKSTLTTVIDFFLLSPNIEIMEVQGIHLNFEHSDHNPVNLLIRLAD